MFSNQRSPRENAGSKVAVKVRWRKGSSQMLTPTMAVVLRGVGWCLRADTILVNSGGKQ
jgi:hypothetical protein